MTPPSEKRCPTCGGPPGKPRNRLFGHTVPQGYRRIASAEAECADPFHSPEADEQAGERFTICSECGWNLGVDDLDEGHVPKGIPADGNCPWCGEPLIEVIPASSSIPTEKVREVVEWATARADYLGAERLYVAASVAHDAVRRLSALVEGTEE